MNITEEKLTIFCAIIAVAGIAAIFAIAAVSEPAEMSVFEAQGSTSGAKVKMHGFIDSAVIYENRAIISLGNIQAIEAVSFDTDYVKSLGLQRFKEVAVDGELREYQGKISLIISKVRQLNTSLGCGDGSGD